MKQRVGAALLLRLRPSGTIFPDSLVYAKRLHYVVPFRLFFFPYVQVSHNHLSLSPQPKKNNADCQITRGLEKNKTKHQIMFFHEPVTETKTCFPRCKGWIFTHEDTLVPPLPSCRAPRCEVTSEAPRWVSSVGESQAMLFWNNRYTLHVSPRTVRLNQLQPPSDESENRTRNPTELGSIWGPAGVIYHPEGGRGRAVSPNPQITLSLLCPPWRTRQNWGTTPHGTNTWRPLSLDGIFSGGNVIVRPGMGALDVNRAVQSRLSVHLDSFFCIRCFQQHQQMK